MSKTIEEAAREATRKEYFCESCAYKGDCDLCGGQNTAFDCCECPADSYEDGFKAGASHALSLPLSQRLTDEERDWIKKIHEDELEFAQFYQRKADSCFNQRCKIDYEVARDIAKSRAGLVEAIFGKELFGEGEGC